MPQPLWKGSADLRGYIQSYCFLSEKLESEEEMMKESFLFLLLIFMLSGCVKNTNNDGFLEIKQQSTEINISEEQVTFAPSLLLKSTASDETKVLPNLENVSIEYYLNNSVKPELITSEK